MGKIRTKVIDLSREEPITKSKKEERRSKKHRDKEVVIEDEKEIERPRDQEIKEIEKDKETEPSSAEATEEGKKTTPPPPPKPPKKEGKPSRGKTYLNKTKLIDKDKEYSLDEALDLVKKSSFGRFDATIDCHINLGIDVTQSDQIVKFPITFPYNPGKPPKVLTITNQSISVKDVLVGGEETIEKIESGDLKPGKDFDVVVAVPQLMAKVAKVAKILGPKGMMPSPKTGTVTDDPEKAIEELNRGKMTLKNEPSAPILHAKIGKCSFKNSAIKENFTALYNELLKNKPQKAKGTFVKSIFLTSTMGPSVKIDLQSLNS